MNTSARLQPMVAIAQQKADDAACKVAECQKKVKDRKLQLKKLVGYREDYTNGLQQKRQSGLNAARMNGYIKFIEHLNLAIEKQQAILECACSELLTSKRIWLGKQQRARALENVISRHKKCERQEQSRREQNESDEHALRVVRTVVS